MSDVPPKPTDRGVIGMNLDARAPVATAPFDVDNANSYSGSTTLSVFDSLGREHSLSLYMRKTAANAWEMHGTVDGTPVSPTAVGSLGFDSAGRLTSGAVDLTLQLHTNTPRGAQGPVAR